MRTPRLVAALLVLVAGAVRADEIDDLRAQIEQSIREGHRDMVDDVIELAMRRASAANAPVRLGRIELFTAELDADRPTARTVARARKAVLHIGDAPEAALALARWHTSGAQVAIGEQRLGAAALHLQEGRAALARAAPATGQAAMGQPDPRRDLGRLILVERQLLAQLRDAIVERGAAAAVLSAGHRAVLAWIATGHPLRPGPGGEEPVLPPRPALSSEALLSRLDRVLAQAEDREIAYVLAQGDEKAAASMQSRHAETLLRVGRVADAVAARKRALAYYRERGTVDQVVAEARWIAERAERNPRATYLARRDEGREIDGALARIVGPARAAAHERHRGELAALAAAAIALAGDRGGRSGAAFAGVSPVGLVAAIDRLHGRYAWDQAALFGDPARWQRLGAVAAVLRGALAAIARDENQVALGADGLALDLAAPGMRARQRAADTMARADSTGPAAPTGGTAIDAVALAARLGARTLVVYGRLDAEQLAIAVMPPRGPTRLVATRLSTAEAVRLATQLRDALYDGRADWMSPAFALYAALVAPVEAQFAGPLVIVPDGVLSALPFAALLDARGHLLGERAELSFAPSLRWLARPAAPRTAGAGAVLVAVPRFTEAGVAPLAGTERSTAVIRTTLEAVGVVPARVSPATAPAQLLAEVGPVAVLHVITRLRLDPTMPVAGALMLATGPLFAHELGSGRLAADLMVLDAPPQPGGLTPPGVALGLEGVIGAALDGPARTLVLATLAVESPSSSVLLARFYEHRALGATPAAALARAQREMANRQLEQPLLLGAGADPLTDGNRFAHPRHWAGFAVWGEP